jgi:hypothetical protein
MKTLGVEHLHTHAPSGVVSVPAGSVCGAAELHCGDREHWDYGTLQYVYVHAVPGGFPILASRLPARKHFLSAACIACSIFT